MKKAISLLLAMSLLLACFVGVICIAEYTTTTETDETADSDLPKIRYYYKDSDGALALTDDSETFDANMASTDSVDVIFELEYPEVDSSGRESLTLESTHEEVNAVKAAYHAKVKDANTAANKAFIEENGISVDSDDYTVYASIYSPFVQISFESYVDYTDYFSDIIAIAECDEVSAIDITIPVEYGDDSATRVSSSSASKYQISDAISDINASSTTSNGKGVTVGIIEAGGVTTSSENDDLNNLTIYASSSVISDHATAVARILCGTNGVAPGVDEVYVYYAKSTSYLVSGMDWLTDNECDVINSSRSTLGLEGQYHWTSAVLDYYVGLLFVTYVNSAGNTGVNEEYEHYTSNYGMGYNVIAVAATDSLGNISTYSSYGTQSGIYTRKPTVSAPGTKITISGTNLGSGTSYAAPMVAGVVAKLMCETPSLKLYPEIVMAALIASATPVTGQSNSWDTYAGAGIIDYEKAREAVANCSTYTFNTDYTGLRATKTASVSTGTRVKVVAFWLTNSMTQSSSDTVVLNNFTNYYINLTTTGGTILSYGSTAFNIEYINYSNSSYSTLKVKLYQSGEKANSYTDYVAVTWVTE